MMHGLQCWGQNNAKSRSGRSLCGCKHGQSLIQFAWLRIRQALWSFDAIGRTCILALGNPDSLDKFK